MKLLSFFIFTFSQISFGAEFMPKAFEAEFDQISISKISKKSKPKIKRKPISIKYKYSGNIVLKDEMTTVVCNPKRMWHYTPPFDEFSKKEKGELQVGDSSRNCFSKLFDSLRLGLKDNKLYKVKKIDSLKYDLIFEKKVQKQLRAMKLELNFKDEKNLVMSNLSSFAIYKNLKKKPVTYETKTLRAVKSFPSGTFIFKVPKNTNTTKI